MLNSIGKSPFIYLIEQLKNSFFKISPLYSELWRDTYSQFIKVKDLPYSLFHTRGITSTPTADISIKGFSFNWGYSLKGLPQTQFKMPSIFKGDTFYLGKSFGIVYNKNIPSRMFASDSFTFKSDSVTKLIQDQYINFDIFTTGSLTKSKNIWFSKENLKLLAGSIDDTAQTTTPQFTKSFDDFGLFLSPEEYAYNLRNVKGVYSVSHSVMPTKFTDILLADIVTPSTAIKTPQPISFGVTMFGFNLKPDTLPKTNILKTYSDYITVSQTGLTKIKGDLISYSPSIITSTKEVFIRNNFLKTVSSDLIPTKNEIIPVKRDIIPTSRDIIPVGDRLPIPISREIIPIETDIVPIKITNIYEYVIPIDPIDPIPIKPLPIDPIEVIPPLPIYPLYASGDTRDWLLWGHRSKSTTLGERRVTVASLSAGLFGLKTKSLRGTSLDTRFEALPPRQYTNFKTPDVSKIFSSAPVLPTTTKKKKKRTLVSTKTTNTKKLLSSLNKKLKL